MARSRVRSLRAIGAFLLLSGPVGILVAFALLGGAESASATAAYEYDKAHLIVLKHVVNDDGGSATASQFTMTIGGVTAAGGNSFQGSEAGTDKLVTLGSYTVAESGPAGYTASFSSGCSSSIAAGATKTCTVTNDDNALPRRVLMCLHLGRRAFTVIVPRPLVPVFLALGATLGPC